MGPAEEEGRQTEQCGLDKVAPTQSVCLQEALSRDDRPESDRSTWKIGAHLSHRHTVWRSEPK